ncbi:MAG: polysaccharide biosynthesis tyrosine autokinase [Deltaproteobacteria bacterium]|nr:polysaccharide biosynthesis tyrosine autokinase [Deltaproteobacteria bacterium]
MFRALIRRKWVFLEAVAFFLAAACAITAFLPEQYEATAQVVVASTDPAGGILADLGSSETTRAIAPPRNDRQDGATLAVLKPVLEKIVWKLQLRDRHGRLLRPERLASAGRLDAILGAPRISVTQPRGTRVLLVQATSGEAELARMLADTTVAVLLEEASEGRPVEEAPPATVASGEVPPQAPLVSTPSPSVQPASRPEKPSRPRLLPNLAAGLLLGVLVGFGLVATFELLDDTVRTPEDLAEAWDSRQLGCLPRWGHRGRRILLTNLPANAPESEPYRLVRSAIAHALPGDPPHVLAVVSSLPGEGRSTVAANLAVAFARDGRRVVLVDADLRQPVLNRLFPEIRDRPGVSDVVLGKARLEEALQSLPVEGLRLLATGTPPEDPVAVIESPEMRRLLLDVARSCDLVLVDTPPVASANDAVLLGLQVDGLVVVVEAGRATRRVLGEIRRRLEAFGLSPLGLVLNRSEASWFFAGTGPGRRRRTAGGGS